MSDKSNQPELQHAQMLAECHLYGVDVAQEKLDIWDGNQAFEIKNSKTAIKRWLKKIPSHSCIAMEATGACHEMLAELAFESGRLVYVINPRLIKQYRGSQSVRYKNDTLDARLIARYVEKEGDQLHPYSPPSDSSQRIAALLSYRKTLSHSRTRLNQNQIRTLPRLPASLSGGAAVKAIQSEIKKIDRELKQFLEEVDEENFKRLQRIKGVGPLTSAWLCRLFGDRTFVKADAAVKFVGMDLVFEDSGKKVGRRRTSKHGDAELRRVLYCAASSAAMTSEWSGIYQRYLEKGFEPIQATCILARKILRTAWAVYYHGTEFDPQRINSQPA